MKIKARIQKVTHHIIDNTPVISYLVPTRNKDTKKTDWFQFFVWNPTHQDKYRPGRTAEITFEIKSCRKGGWFNQQTDITFDTHDVHDRQTSLPGM